jgi:hypothetical protein
MQQLREGRGNQIMDLCIRIAVVVVNETADKNALNIIESKICL